MSRAIWELLRGGLCGVAFATAVFAAGLWGGAFG